MLEQEYFGIKWSCYDIFGVKQCLNDIFCLKCQNEIIVGFQFISNTHHWKNVTHHIGWKMQNFITLS
jgi:hypothetical protein